MWNGEIFIMFLSQPALRLHVFLREVYSVCNNTWTASQHRHPQARKGGQKVREQRTVLNSKCWEQMWGFWKEAGGAWAYPLQVFGILPELPSPQTLVAPAPAWMPRPVLLILEIRQMVLNDWSLALRDFSCLPLIHSSSFQYLLVNVSPLEKD